MNKLQVFLARYSITTHTFVTLSTTLVAAYFYVPEFHNYVWEVYTGLPKGLKAFIGAMVPTIMWYWRGRKSWPPDQRAAAAPVTGSAPIGTSAGGDNPDFEKSKLAPSSSQAIGTSPQKPSSDPGW